MSKETDPAPSDDSSVTIGTQLSGIYELDKRIALGGMGEVYRGHNILTGDAVAIKIVLPELARDETILSLFKKEASVLNHLSHDAIVRYHVFTVDAGIGRPYLAMEFVDGEPLIEAIERGPMPLDDVRRLCLRLASALAAAHEAGVIHRDLSPDNIILPRGRVERAKIIDFGIAKSAVVGGSTLLDGKFAGKYNYVSPEQLGLFGGAATERSDIYSLGLVLAAAMRGEPLDMSGSPVEVIEKRRVVPDISDVDATLRPLLQAMLQPDPRDRPVGMAELGAWVSSPQASAAEPTSAPSRLPVSVPAADVTALAPPAAAVAASSGRERPVSLAVPDMAAGTSAAATVPPPARSSRLRATALGALAAAALVAGGGYYYYVDGIRGAARPQTSDGGEAVASRNGDAGAVQKAPSPGDAEGPPPAPAQEATAEVPVQDTAPAEVEQVATHAEPPLAQPEQPSLLPSEQAEEPAPGLTQAPTQMPAPTETVVSPPPAQTAALGPQTDVVGVLDEMARRVSWVNEYPGGSCFHATVLSATDKAIRIEGFGKSVDPFVELLAAFQDTFRMEPDIGVRLIEPEQCVVADFLHALRNSPRAAPHLDIEASVIPSGSELRGQLKNPGGDRTDLILVDHKGTAFNISDRMVSTTESISFSLKVGLAGNAEDLSRPQLIVAVVSHDGVRAASFSRPTPASELFPRILDEIGASKSHSAVTAKYFRLGG